MPVVRQREGRQVEIVSHAQNFEDVMLWRALGQVREGFWIDVGANDPDKHSITRAFSERGWRGINLEPVASHFARLRKARPRDINLKLAAAAAPGRLTLHRIGTTGLSTLDAEIAAAHARNGWPVETESVEVTTLAEVCRRHVTGPVHFLKIDVEGAEREVLLGADFTACRPWIVLVEAIRPDTGEPSHAGWEPILLAAGYRFVWFDALNRFYVAQEHLEELVPQFMVPLHAEAESPAVPEDDRPPRPDRTVASSPSRAALAGAGAALPPRSLAPGRPDAAAHARLLTGVGSQVGLAGWKLVRPVLRPVLWRLRSFLNAGLEREIAGLRSEHAQTLRTVVSLVASGGLAMPPEAGRAAAGALRAAGAMALRRVHQFHSGSVTADAITSAMFLLRTVLREAGYESEIFVEHPDPVLRDDLFSLEAMPRHGDYLLIVHHAIGHGVSDRVAALPAPKLLFYHTITPPEFPGTLPGLAAAAEGRRQLAAWRRHVVAAIAESAFDALDLRALGYDVVLECPLMLDADALRARTEARPPRAAAPPGEPAAPFTVLFVGRIAECKGQDDLIEAFAAFRAGFDRSCRLVLVGRGSAAALAALRVRADRHGLGAAVDLPGAVSDDALQEIYAIADLYVSLSRQEGIGVPLVQAMAHGVPVLAWPAGAVPYTLAGAGHLLHDRAPPAVAEAMLALARDPGRRAALAAAGRRRLGDFGLDRVRPVLQAALSFAGAAPPLPAGLRAQIIANLHVTVAGRMNGSCGPAEVNRRIALVAEAARPGQVRVLAYEDGRPAAPEDVPAGQLAKLRAMAARPPPPTGPELVLTQHWPPLRPSHRGDLPLAMVFWEQTAVSHEAAATLSEFRGVLAPAPSVARALIDSGVSAPVAVCGHAPDLAAFAALAVRRSPRSGAVFTVLHVSSGVPRKGIDVLLAAWAAAFRAADKVRLVIKTLGDPHNDVADWVAALRARKAGVAAIEVIDRELDPAALLALYADADAMVLPSRGEGFNLPAAEAIAAGLALVVTGFGGHMAYCDIPGAARLLRFRLRPAAGQPTPPGAFWAEPDLDDLVAALRALPSAAVDPKLAALRLAAREAVLARLDPGAWLDRVYGIAADLLLAPPPRPQRLAWVSPWRVACGIAMHARGLLGAFADHPGFASRYPVVLCDTRPWTADDELAIRGTAAWKVGDPGGGAALALAVAAEDPDIVLVQHQTALIPFPALADLLEHPALRRRVVVVMLHSTEDLRAAPAALRTRAVEALRRAARVLVHTGRDLDTLQDLGLLERAALLPHGAPASRPPRTPRKLPPESAPVIGCHGFVLPGKGMQVLIAAAARLRAVWPGLRLRMVTALFPSDVSKTELDACWALADRLGMDDAIEWHTDFLPVGRVLDLLEPSDVIALPYQESCNSASGAVRMAAATGMPVAVTGLRLFEEAGEAVWRLPSATGAGVAEGLAALLRDRPAREQVQRAAQEWLRRDRWDDVAARLQAMLLALAAAHTSAR